MNGSSLARAHGLSSVFSVQFSWVLYQQLRAWCYRVTDSPNRVEGVKLGLSFLRFKVFFVPWYFELVPLDKECYCSVKRLKFMLVNWWEGLLSSSCCIITVIVAYTHCHVIFKLLLWRFLCCLICIVSSGFSRCSASRKSPVLCLTDLFKGA
jgi:hypothetical protein